MQHAKNQTEPAGEQPHLSRGVELDVLPALEIAVHMAVGAVEGGLPNLANRQVQPHIAATQRVEGSLHTSKESLPID